MRYLRGSRSQCCSSLHESDSKLERYYGLDGLGGIPIVSTGGGGKAILMFGGANKRARSIVF
jgi:hypothetical protein